MIIPRVAATAQLANTRGTYEQTQDLAYEKTFAVCKKVHDTFSKGEEVTLGKLKEFVAPHADGIDYEIKPYNPKILKSNFKAFVSSKIKKNTVTGFSINLPTQNNLLDPKNLDTIAHELLHFFSGITTPKISGRTTLKKIINHQSNKQLAVLAGSVPIILLASGTYLGAAIPAVGVFIAQKIFPKKIFDFYKGSLYKSCNKNSDLNKIKETAKELLQKSRLKDSEKIDILQSWRYGLKDEQNAYTNSFQIANLLLIKSTEKRIPFENIKKAVNHDYLLEEKIAMTEDLLKEEIAAHRQKHREKLRQKKPEFSIKSLFQNLLKKDYSSSKSKKSSSSSISS